MVNAPLRVACCPGCGCVGGLNLELSAHKFVYRHQIYGLETKMFKIRTRAVTLALAAAVAVTSFTPSFALPMPSVSAAQPAVSGAASSDVQQVQYWRHRGGGYYRGGYGRGYYGGYRGYHGYRHGYRYHDGYWFPLAAFGAGALIGGAIASEPRTYARPAAGINPRHYEWCANRYRSYRGYDNTFQPNHGPRQQCLSPFY